MIAFLTAIAAGTALLAAGLHLLLKGFRTPASAAEGYSRWVYFGRSFRFAIVGLSAIVAAAGFTFDQRTLAWAFVIIGLQELYESSVLVAILQAAETDRLSAE